LLRFLDRLDVFESVLTAAHRTQPFAAYRPSAIDNTRPGDLGAQRGLASIGSVLRGQSAIEI
jgi:hypothetical protein